MKMVLEKESRIDGALVVCTAPVASLASLERLIETEAASKVRRSHESGPRAAMQENNIRKCSFFEPVCVNGSFFVQASPCGIGIGAANWSIYYADALIFVRVARVASQSISFLPLPRQAPYRGILPSSLPLASVAAAPAERGVRKDLMKLKERIAASGCGVVVIPCDPCSWELFRMLSVWCGKRLRIMFPRSKELVRGEISAMTEWLNPEVNLDVAALECAEGLFDLSLDDGGDQPVLCCSMDDQGRGSAADALCAFPESTVIFVDERRGAQEALLEAHQRVRGVYRHPLDFSTSSADLERFLKRCGCEAALPDGGGDDEGIRRQDIDLSLEP